MRFTKKPFLFQIDVFNEKEKVLERKKILVSRPLGGTFRVTNGDILCDITLDDRGVLVRCQSKRGDFEYISTKKISA